MQSDAGGDDFGGVLCWAVVGDECYFEVVGGCEPFSNLVGMVVEA